METTAARRTAMLLAVTAAASLWLSACRSGPDPPGGVGVARDYAVSATASSAAAPHEVDVPPPPRVDASRGLLAYVRGGTVYVREALGEPSGERRVAPAGEGAGPAMALCPTFVPDGRLMVVEPGAGLWVFDPLSGVGGHILPTLDVIALGVDYSSGEPLVGLVDSSGPEVPYDAATKWYVARVRDWHDLEPIGVRSESTNPPRMVEEPYHRLRTSADLGLIAVPRFPTDVSACYELRWARRGGFDAVDWSVWGADEDRWYTIRSSGVDFGATDGLAPRSDGPPIYVVAEGGLCRLRRGTPQRRSWVLQPRAGLGELAVSERLGVGAVSTWGREVGAAVKVFSLADGSPVASVAGGDPDLWPR